MSATGLRVVRSQAPESDDSDAAGGWLAWLGDHVDQAWRCSEWDRALWLFSGDLRSDRTAVWPCRTPGCPTATRQCGGRCSTCRRARVVAGVSEEDFDREPRRPPPRPNVAAACLVPGCVGEHYSNGLCVGHQRAWRRDGVAALTAFVASASPFERLERCLVPGCGRERVCRRGLCRFHDGRLRRAGLLAEMSPAEVASWAAGEKPRLGPHQFSLAPLGELARFELIYALQRRDTTPPPLDPM
ncbi:MAG: hypothetical protein ACRDS0_37520, partial [Pseudonocardiaceae bacterium]